MPKIRPVEERFNGKVDRSGGPDACWLWTGQHTAFGHGKIGTKGAGRVYVHRLAWEIANGPIPIGACVLHRCDVPACVNPVHLFLGTKTDNARDMAAKGRAAGTARKGTPRNKLTASKVVEIRARRASGETYASIARAYDVTYVCIIRAVSRQAWASVP